ncbi:MAG: FHA domain-containing protein [Planctomycetes bacterium]|nr:FHA domain-containing protein [Planctomycetota bacterium]
MAWLSWWWQARGAFTRQVGPARPPRALRLVPAPGEPVALVALGPEPGLLLIGRDARCQVRLEHPTVSRLHAAALRLHRRLVLRDEGGAAGTRLDGVPLHVGLLDPGAALRLGEASLVVEGRDLPAEGPRGARLVDAATFHALDEAGHPATLVGHLAVLEAAARLGAAPAESLAHDLHPGDAARAAAVAHHVRRLARAANGRARQALRRPCSAATPGPSRPPGPTWRAGRGRSRRRWPPPAGCDRARSSVHAGDLRVQCAAASSASPWRPARRPGRRDEQEGRAT